MYSYKACTHTHTHTQSKQTNKNEQIKQNRLLRAEGTYFLIDLQFSQCVALHKLTFYTLV